MARRSKAPKAPKPEVTYKPAPAAEEVANALMHDGEFTELSGLVNCKIGFMFVSETMKLPGQRIALGKCCKCSPKDKALHGKDFIILISHPEWRTLNDHCRRALVYHELRHIDAYEGKDGSRKFRLAYHEVEMFQAELRKFGPWTSNLTTLVDNAKALQLEMFGEAKTRVRKSPDGDAAVDANGVANGKANGKAAASGEKPAPKGKTPLTVVGGDSDAKEALQANA